MAETLRTAPQVLQCSFQSHWTNARKITNVAYFQYSATSITGAEANEGVAKYRDEWQDKIIGPGVNNFTFEGVNYVDLNDTEGVTGFVAANPAKPITGTDSASSAPPNYAMLVRKNVAGSGRGARSGRWYICGVPEPENTEDGALSAPQLSIWQTKFTSLLTAWNAVTTGPVAE